MEEEVQGGPARGRACGDRGTRGRGCDRCANRGRDLMTLKMRLLMVDAVEWLIEEDMDMDVGVGVGVDVVELATLIARV